MRLLMVASEALPFAKTGGLADVIGALPRALARLGHHVDVVMPRYRGITAGEKTGELPVALGGQVSAAGIHVAIVDGVRMVFIDRPDYYDREFLYGAVGRDYHDNPERFAFLTQAALDWAMSTGQRYDVAHAHDWQVGLLPVLATRMFRTHELVRRMATVFTIHNLAYQGLSMRAGCRGWGSGGS